MKKRFTLGSSSVGELEKTYVLDVLNSNFISPGPVVAEVERECARIHGLKHGLAIHSGQSAIHVAIQAMVDLWIKDTLHEGRKPLVAVPACTYISTLAAAVLAGCEIVLVDVEIPGGNMCPESLSRVLWHYEKINRPVDIVIPVHLFGQACSPKIRELCESYDVYVIEDSCESTFAEGTGWGHILTTSFFSNHLISGGGGGMIMTNHERLDLHCWKLINHGRSNRFGNDDIHQIAEKFHFDTWGHSMKWSDVPAAIVKAQIERRKELYDARQTNANILFNKLWALDADHGWVRLPDYTKPYPHTFMVYPLVLGDKLDAQNVIKELNDGGIEIRRMMPITNQPVVEQYFRGEDLEWECPNAETLNSQGFYVGVHPELTGDDMNAMADIIYAAIQKEGRRVETR